MPSIDSIAAEYVERTVALDPSFATYAGIAGHDDELPDLSADGFAERAELDRSTREKDACGPEVYARASRFFLGAAVDLQEARPAPGDSTNAAARPNSSGSPYRRSGMCPDSRARCFLARRLVLAHRPQDRRLPGPGRRR